MILLDRFLYGAGRVVQNFYKSLFLWHRGWGWGDVGVGWIFPIWVIVPNFPVFLGRWGGTSLIINVNKSVLTSTKWKQLALMHKKKKQVNYPKT